MAEQPEPTTAGVNKPIEEEVLAPEAAGEEKMSPEEAIAHYTAQIAANPDDALAYLNRDNAHYSAGDLDAAIDDYRTAIKLNGNLAEAYMQRGYALYGKNNLNAAASDFREVTRLVPDDPIGHNNLAFLYMLMNRTSRAEAAWSRATALEGAPAYAFAGHAVALYRMKKRRPAYDAYRRAIELDSRWQDDLEAAAEEVSWPDGMIATAREILVQLGREQATEDAK